MKVKRIGREVLKNLLVLGVLFFPLSCGEEEVPPPTPPTINYAFVITTDYEVGSFSTITLDEPRTVTKNIGFVHSDAQVRSYQGKIYVLNRLGQDNIQVLDPDKDLTTVKQFTVGNWSNPHDIAFVSEEKAYVSRYEEETLLVVNPSTGEALDTIDLSSFADPDGIPEMDQMLIIEGKLYVSVQRLDRNDPLWSPTDASYLAVIDIETDTLIDLDEALPGVQGITLTGKQPFTSLVLDPQSGKILVGEVGAFFDPTDGGIDVIDPVTNKAEGFLITEEELEGDIYDVEIISPEKGYAVVMDASFNTNLVSFNPGTGEKIDDIFTPTGFVLADIAVNEREELYISDRTMESPGIRVFNTEDDEEITTSPIDVGLPPGTPPNSIIFIE